MKRRGSMKRVALALAVLVVGLGGSSMVAVGVGAAQAPGAFPPRPVQFVSVAKALVVETSKGLANIPIDSAGYSRVRLSFAINPAEGEPQDADAQISVGVTKFTQGYQVGITQSDPHKGGWYYGTLSYDVHGPDESFGVYFHQPQAMKTRKWNVRVDGYFLP
jgi:hypothetical protein